MKREGKERGVRGRGIGGNAVGDSARVFLSTEGLGKRKSCGGIGIEVEVGVADVFFFFSCFVVVGMVVVLMLAMLLSVVFFLLIHFFIGVDG